MMADWHPLGAILYRKWEVYDMEWPDPKQQRQLDQYMMCGAPFAGPIAMVGGSRPNELLIHTSAGRLLATIDLQATATTATAVTTAAAAGSSGGDSNNSSSEQQQQSVVGMGWSDQEHLIVVREFGLVDMFDIHGASVTQFQLIDRSRSSNAGQGRIIECHFWGNGLAAIVASHAIVHVAEGLSAAELSSVGPRVHSLRTGLGTDRSYSCMAIVPPLLSRSGLLEVLVGTSDNSVLVLHEAEVDNIIEDQLLQQKIAAPIDKIAVAPNGRFLACYRTDGILTVMSAAFTTKVLDFDAKSLSSPLEIAWCGEDAVVMQWRNTGIIMVGPYGDWLNFPYPDAAAVHLVAEPDCCRIITSHCCEILQRVPSSTVAIRSVGSTDPAALMFDAMEAFEEGDPKSDENIRSIAAANQLSDAVLACISAAAAEFNVSNQQSFLKAASYGKAFCPEADPTEFVETARKLRVLNEVRKASVGLPLTVQQYNRLTPEVLVGRLTMRKHHFLALRICELLKLKNERVLVHWACEKVRQMSVTAASDEDINSVIRRQLEPFGRISYLAIAEAAYSRGRRRLATFIIDREQYAGDQIPLLLRMNEEELALQKAINSEDTDLIYYTLISLESRFLNSSNSNSSSGGNSNSSAAQVDFFNKIVHNHLEAANLMKIYYRNKVTAEDRSQLHHLLMHSKNHFEAGAAAVNQAFQQQATVSKVQLLREAAQLFAAGRETAFYKSMTDDQIDLLDLQKALEMRSQSKRDFLNLTLAETMEQLILLCLQDPMESRWTEQELQKLAKRFKVPEKLLWHMKIRLYSENGAWNLLSQLAQEKKSPVGYKPFARACIKFDRPIVETERYIERVTSMEDKFQVLVELKSWSKAADVAVKLRDPQKLQEVSVRCQDTGLERYIQEVIAKM